MTAWPSKPGGEKWEMGGELGIPTSVIGAEIPKEVAIAFLSGGLDLRAYWLRNQGRDERTPSYTIWHAIGQNS